MPSETRVDEVLGILERPREAFRTAVVTSVEQLRAALSSGDEASPDRAERLADELGPFAAGRVDFDRLLVALEDRPELDAPAREVVQRAVEVLALRIAENGEGGVAVVPEGEDLRDVVRDALSEAGRAFGSARAAELARLGGYDPGEHNALFSGHPFRRWTRAERLVAPPLVVEVDGDDLRPAGLADFLDGSLKIVLLVGGTAPPAALARLVSPGVFVMQTREAERIREAGDFSGPAVVALFDDEAIEMVPFVHDPRAGGAHGDRLAIDGDPEELRARMKSANWKDRWWAEDLAHLLDLATPTAPEAGEGGAEETSEAATGPDKLAAWLLAQTTLDEG